MSSNLQATDFLSLPEFTVATLPAEDRLSFGSLSTTESELSAWANACERKYRQQISELETYIATARSLRNTCSPISRLPNELLADVFADPSLVLQTCIRRVCRRWRCVLLGTSRFWAKCISRSSFEASVRDRTFLCAALQHSGALSVSIELEDTDPVSSPTIWNALSEHHARIAELSVETSSSVGDGCSSRVDHLFHSRRMDLLHTLRLRSNTKVPSSEEGGLLWDQSNLPALRTLVVSAGVMSPSRVVASLTTLRLENVHLTLTMFIDVLNKCPLLESLQLGLKTLAEVDPNIDDRAISLPHLRKCTIIEIGRNIARLLGPFKSQSFSTRTLLTLHPMGNGSLPRAIHRHQVFAPPEMHRMCIESDGGRVVTRLFCDSSERLRISSQFGVHHQILNTFVTSISVLIVNSRHCHVDSENTWGIERWTLPRLQRLELAQMLTAAHKYSVAKIFLERFGHRAGELSLAWVLPIHAGQETQSLAEEELQYLLCVVCKHADSGKPRLGRLELYAVEQGKWKPFNGRIEVGSDPRLCSEIVEPFLADLKTRVDVVHVG